MPERLKDIFFTDQFIDRLGQQIQQVYPQFDAQRYTQLVHDDEWQARELKQKMRHITQALHQTLPHDYPQALKILLRIGPSFHGFDAMIFPDFVECYGLDHWQLSMPALAEFTKLCSSEFAVRPFLDRDPERALATMQSWAGNEDERVRRLASEGCRPRLPWAVTLPKFKQNPAPILPILEMLKDDESESVRRSVANNLNDISKDHPDLVLDICQRWYGQSDNTDWIVKHACRTLLKAGNRRAMRLFGFGDPTHIRVENLTVDRQALRIGQDIRFNFDLAVDTESECRIRLEYVVDYVKAGGKRSGKVFQIREASFKPGRHNVSKKHSFADRSTRKHYPGEHSITLVVNGVDKAEVCVDLTLA